MNCVENPPNSKPFVLEGPKLHLPKNYGGLGVHYFTNLATKLDKILQVDATSGVAETNGSVRGRSIMIALKLKEMRIGQNDIVLIMSRCHSEQTIVVLASLLIGAIVAPLDPDLSYSECRELIGCLKPQICFCDIRSISQIERALNDLNFNKCQIVNFGQSHDSAIQFLKLFTYKEDNTFEPVVINEPQTTVAFIVATQGTTEFPKLVSLSHNNVLLQTLIFLEIVDKPTKVLSFFPLSWIMEIIMMCVSFEALIVRIIPGVFQERLACKLIHDLEIDFLLLGTHFTLQLIENVAIKDFNIKCLRCIAVGTTVTSKVHMQRFRSLLPQMKFIQIYFTTETGLIAANCLNAYVQSCDKPSAVGRILHSARIKIVDIENGREMLGAHKYGRLLYNGDGLMLGYYKDLIRTNKALEQGFFSTGDVAEFDEDGWLYVYGRVDDLIRMEKATFRPNELEDVLLIHPLVENVIVVSNGRELVACVVKKTQSGLAPEGLLAFVNNRLPPHLHPTRVILMDNLPKTTIGEVKRRRLREELFNIRIDYRTSLASVAL